MFTKLQYFAKNILIFLFVFISALYLNISCRAYEEDNIDSKKTSSTIKVDSNNSDNDKYTTKTKEVTVRGTLNTEQIISRTAMPEYFPIVTDYEITVTKEYEYDYTRTCEIDNSQTPPTFSITLPYGIWNFTAYAKDSNGYVVFTQTKSIELSETQDVITENFDFSSGMGDIDLSVNVPYEVNRVDYKLSKGSQVVQENTIWSPYDSFRIQCYTETGTYILTLYFYDYWDELVFRIDQAVNVYAGLTTNKFISGGSYYTIDSDGSIVVTTENIQDFWLYTIFVGGDNASDGNTGTQFDPVSTLGRAFSLARRAYQLGNVPSDGFNIYIQGDITEYSDFTIDSDMKISFWGAEPTELYTINGNANNFWVYGDLTIANVAFNGIDIYQEGTFSLAGSTKFTDANITLAGDRYITIADTLTASAVANIVLLDERFVKGNCVLVADTGVPLTQAICNKFTLLKWDGTANTVFGILPSNDGSQGVLATPKAGVTVGISNDTYTFTLKQGEATISDGGTISTNSPIAFSVTQNGSALADNTVTYTIELRQNGKAFISATSSIGTGNKITIPTALANVNGTYDIYMKVTTPYGFADNTVRRVTVRSGT